MNDELLVLFAVARLLEGLFCTRMAFRHRRYSVLLWGVLAIVLAFPIAAHGFGVELPGATVVAIAAGHAVLGMCVCAAMVSSTAEGRRVSEFARKLGFTLPTTNGWRP